MAFVQTRAWRVCMRVIGSLARVLSASGRP